MSGARGYADTAAEYLAAAGEGIGLWSVATRSDDDPARQVAALQGIGWALLALRDQAGEHLADLADAIADVVVRLSEIADAASAAGATGRPGRIRDALARMIWAWAGRPGRRVPEPGAVVLSAAPAGGVVSGISGPGKSALMARYLEQWLRDHPGGVVQVIPLGALQDDPDGVVLSAAEAGTVWQALSDAAAWRTVRSGEDGCAGCAEHAAGPEGARCPEHAGDDVIAARYAALQARLGGDHR